MTATRTVTAHGFRVELDLSTQVLAVRAPADTAYGIRDSDEAPLSATLGGLSPMALMSASVLAQKAKIFDDGLYAAVEVAAQQGAGRFRGKAALLESLGRRLLGAEPAAAGDAQRLLLAAARLGEVALPSLPPTLEPDVHRTVAGFLADELRSKPIGFYTWSGQLTRIFQQDRMLQEALGSSAGIMTLASALRADASARATYEAYLHLVSRLTNPFSVPDLRSALAALDRGDDAEPDAATRFLPPSVAHETTLIKRLYGTSPIPEGFVLVEEMIRRIRSGVLDLTPGPESGWYDHQTWSLEPLVIPERTPEAAHLTLDDEYRTLLLELFRGLLTLTRETHIKQLEMPPVGMALHPGRTPREETFIDIAPALTAEPLATFYLRRGLGYRFIRDVLNETFGPAGVERLHRLTASGPVGRSLAEELTDMEALWLGAHVTTARELGMAPDEVGGVGERAGILEQEFTRWTHGLERDPDLRQDLRAMVPVFYDLQRGRTKAWVFLGWSERPVEVSFARPPSATVFDRRGKPAAHHPAIRWHTLDAPLAYPVTAEVYVDRLLDRDEFRKLCDSCGTRTAILRRLGASDEPSPTARDLGGAATLSVRNVCERCGFEYRGQAAAARFCPRCGGVFRRVEAPRPRTR